MPSFRCKYFFVLLKAAVRYLENRGNSKRINPSQPSYEAAARFLHTLKVPYPEIVSFNSGVSAFSGFDFFLRLEITHTKTAKTSILDDFVTLCACYSITLRTDGKHAKELLPLAKKTILESGVRPSVMLYSKIHSAPQRIIERNANGNRFFPRSEYLD